MSLFDFFLNRSDQMSIPKKEVCLDSPKLSIDKTLLEKNSSPAVAQSGLKTPVVLENLRWAPSPNYRTRKGRVISIVLHHTGSNSFEGNISWMCNPDAKAAAHFCVGRKGEIACLVNTKHAAFHAGVSEWEFHGQHYEDLNHWTVGIEICNAGLLTKAKSGKIYQGDGRDAKEYKPLGNIREGSITFPDGRVLSGWYDEYPEVQLQATADLCKALINKYPEITAEDIVTHYQIAPSRKVDPFGLDLEKFRQRVFNG